jgi:hypothetical protein
MSKQVQTIKVSGFLGRPASSINGNCLSITNGKVYLLSGSCITDDQGRKLKLKSKPFRKANGCDYYFSDNSASEGHSDFKIIIKLPS